jgi:hypothetical protein
MTVKFKSRKNPNYQRLYFISNSRSYSLDMWALSGAHYENKSSIISASALVFYGISSPTYTSNINMYMDFKYEKLIQISCLPMLSSSTKCWWLIWNASRHSSVSSTHLSHLHDPLECSRFSRDRTLLYVYFTSSFVSWMTFEILMENETETVNLT